LRIYINLLLTGIALSWGPCFSFCAPIIFPYIAGTQKKWHGGLALGIIFSLARVVSYVTLSLISAGLGHYLIRSFYQNQQAQIIYIAVGAFIVILGILVLAGKSLHQCFHSAAKGSGLKGVGEIIFLGIIVGFAPCLPLFGVLAYIAVQAKGLLHGGLLGLSFGIGTLLSPLIILAPVAAHIPNLLAKRPIIGKIFSRICGLILIYLGLEMLIRSLHIVHNLR